MTDQGKYVANDTPDKGLLSRMYRYLKAQRKENKFILK